MVDDWVKVRGDIKRFEIKGDSIEGELVNVRDGIYFRQDGSKSKVYEILTEEGVKTVFGSPVLERQMATVRVGDNIRIVYKGKLKTKTGREANDFDVFLKK